MNKKLYIIPTILLAGAAFTSCDNTEDEIFDQQASERLEEAKNDYEAKLTSNGGKWVMEYFSNGDEPGYLIGMEFKPSGAVEISANHRWINNQFRSEESCWDVITDDGPVLTFNSYNSLFHIFSDPNNITGEYAPTNPEQNDEDINETGYGHNGDYEFNLMRYNESVDTMYMLGKKRGIHQFLIRLPEGTDMQSYLENEKAVGESIFNATFNDLIITDPATGEEFMMNLAYTAIPEIYPREGDAVMQTVKRNLLLTSKGIRFMNPLEVPRADADADPLVIEKFDIQPDGSLLSPEGVTIRSITPVEVMNKALIFKDGSLGYEIDPETMSADLKAAYDEAVEDVANYKKNKLTKVSLSYYRNRNTNVTEPCVAIRIGSATLHFFVSYNKEKGENLTITQTEYDNNAKTWLGRAPKLENLVNKIAGSSYVVTTPTPLNPFELDFAGQNGGASFKTNLQ